MFDYSISATCILTLFILFLIGDCQSASLTCDPGLSLITTSTPNCTRPYVIPHLRGFASAIGEYVISMPVTNYSSGGGITLLSLRGQTSAQIPTHYHARYHETFFITKGAINLYLQNETRRLGPLDFGSVPVNTNHSFELLEPDTEGLGFITPGGFEFYAAAGNLYESPIFAPFSPNHPVQLDPAKLRNATGPLYDYNPSDYPSNYALVNGTTSDVQHWHDGNNSLPNASFPYYVAGNWGPKYLQRSLGQVAQLYMTGAESNGAMTIALITMRARLPNETVLARRSEGVAQTVTVLEGQLHVEMSGEIAVLSTGDTAVIPANTTYKYWSDVAFTRLYNGAASLQESDTNVFGLAGNLIDEGESWEYAVFPADA